MSIVLTGITKKKPVMSHQASDVDCSGCETAAASKSHTSLQGYRKGWEAAGGRQAPAGRGGALNPMPDPDWSAGLGPSSSRLPTCIEWDYKSLPPSPPPPERQTDSWLTVLQPSTRQRDQQQHTRVEGKQRRGNRHSISTLPPLTRH